MIRRGRAQEIMGEVAHHGQVVEMNR